MIVVNYGKDIVKTAYDALISSDIKKYLKNDLSVSIKPNLVNERPPGDGGTTHPEVIEGIIIFLKDFGIKKINIIENSSAGHSTKKAFKTCGYEELQKKYGVPLIDLNDDKYITLRYKDYGIRICETALNTDLLINAPVLKAHSQTRLTCCMKNLKGCMPKDEMRRFHTLGLHKPVAELNALLKTGYCVVDGICGDLSFEEGGTPVEANRIIAGLNPLLVDSYCAELIGFKPDDIGYLSHGRQLGLGEYYSQKTEVIELNSNLKSLKKLKSSRIADQYKNLITDDSACSVCYAALIYALHRNGSCSVGGRKIYIGQGFRGKSCEGLGIGNCTQGFKSFVKGCPPKATDILASLGGH
ncbi:MAG: DUF362 domain-containing protein [Treponema sp.]|nr:DUF362 domain-containing protein [Treponema sp.]